MGMCLKEWEGMSEGELENSDTKQRRRNVVEEIDIRWYMEMDNAGTWRWITYLSL